MWAKLDDGLLDNPKILAVGPLGLAMHIAGIVWCARNLTDGHIPDGKVATLLDLRGVFTNVGNPTGLSTGDGILGGAESPEPYAVAEALVSVGLWDEDGRGHYLVHDFLDYNPSREAVHSKRSSDRQRQSQHRLSQRESRGVSQRDSVVTRVGIPGTGTGVPCPFPSPLNQRQFSLAPDEAGEGSGEAVGQGSKGGKRKVRRIGRPRVPWPADLALTDELRSFAVEGGLDPGLTWGHFRDYHQAEGTQKADWPAAFRYWCRRAVEMQRGRATR